MSETTVVLPRHGSGAGDDDDRRDPLRPARPQHGVGGLLRRVAGVDEDILDWVPEERPRYTRLGAIVLNTGVMAALSMSVLLTRVNIASWLIPLVALVWGYLIVSFDGWLVASTHGVLGMAKLRIFLPRLLISVLMGAVIAEPLLLRVFAPAIHTEINETRLQQVADYKSELRRCNPVESSTTPAGCDGFVLNVGDSPTGVRQELALATRERDRLRTLINGINTELTRRENLARAECNGDPGPGLTNRRGEGPNCRRNRAEADRYRASSGLDRHQADLVTLNRRIDDLTGRVGSASTTYAAALNVAITDQVEQKQSSREEIGILDEDKALGVLTSQSMFVLIGSWLLRLLLIVIDCLPVLTKLMSRTTTYDALVGRQLNISDRLHDKRSAQWAQEDVGRADVAMYLNEHQIRLEKEEIDERTRKARARHEADLDNQIEDLARRLRDARG